MKKSSQTWLVTILIVIIALAVIFVFNLFDLRTKLVGAIANSYLSGSTTDNTSLIEDADTSGDATPNDQPSLLNEDQAKTLEEYGVDVSQLPSTISPEMEACFVEKLGADRTQEIAGGDSPTATEIVTARNCLDQ